VRVVAGAGDTAVRGVVEYERDDSPLAVKLKALARRAGLPRRLWVPPDTLFGEHPFGVIQLPEIETTGRPFMLATTAEGVWPAPAFVPPSHNLSIRGNPAAVLEVYRALSRAEVKVDSSVSLYGPNIAVEPNHDVVDVSEAIHLIEEALREQGGIVVTQRGSNSVSFTWEERARVGGRR
jgi:hypothetical protein